MGRPSTYMLHTLTTRNPVLERPIEASRVPTFRAAVSQFGKRKGLKLSVSHDPEAGLVRVKRVRER